jgi:predicted ArsR family transcriptional regulator
MLEILGSRQQALLRLLLRKKSGLSIEQLASALEITRTAVRQHLAALTRDGLVATGAIQPSGGRPQQLYVLAAAGRELFPRQYAWLAELMMDSLKQESGTDKLRERLRAMGARIGEQLRQQHPGSLEPQQRIEQLAAVMQQLGYDTDLPEGAGALPTIEADNCVFHDLAMKDPTICEFDRAMLSAFSGAKVEQQECMAHGCNVCRFKFTPKP